MIVKYEATKKFKFTGWGDLLGETQQDVFITRKDNALKAEAELQTGKKNEHKGMLLDKDFYAEHSEGLKETVAITVSLDMIKFNAMVAGGMSADLAGQIVFKK